MIAKGTDFGLEKRLKKKNPDLGVRFDKLREVLEGLLQKYQMNFPEYTDHSSIHAKEVFKYVNLLLTNREINTLHSDEIYILLCASWTHDVGMCIPKAKLDELRSGTKAEEYLTAHPNHSFSDFIRSIHHELSYDFIMKEWNSLHIPDKLYAEAIALVAKGHRKERIDDFSVYKPKFIVQGGATSVCLPYLACLIKLADELDITNIRTPDLLYKYYYPSNQKSQLEFEKHRATYIINISGETIYVKARCTDQTVYIALNELYDKIENVIRDCNKIIRSCSYIEGIRYTFSIKYLEKEIKTSTFVPKKIGFSFDVNKIFQHFISKNLYKENEIAIREALQNAIDTCRLKKKLDRHYEPKIVVSYIDKSIIIKDNGMGMNEFIIENFFAKLANPYYDSSKYKSIFNSIAQFGIGVFSYFLICEYFEVKTKMKNEEPLRFQTDMNPETDFYFFKDTEKVEEGTELILYLKDPLPIEKKDLPQLIKKYIEFIEIPVFYEDNDACKLISTKNFESNLIDLLDPLEMEKVRFFQKKIEFTIVKMKTEEYEAVLGTSITSIREHSLINIIDQKDQSISLIELFNKGITVAKIDSPSLLKIMLGRINFLNEPISFPIHH